MAATLRSARLSNIAQRTTDVDGSRVFYREAGRRDAPVLLLLHGFPTSSHMSRSLIPVLADRDRVIAPDLPGFGFADAPDRAGLPYALAHLAEVSDRFTEVRALKRFAVLVFDYGAPVGFRIALERPDRITALMARRSPPRSANSSRGGPMPRRYRVIGHPRLSDRRHLAASECLGRPLHRWLEANRL